MQFVWFHQSDLFAVSFLTQYYLGDTCSNQLKSSRACEANTVTVSHVGHQYHDLKVRLTGITIIIFSLLPLVVSVRADQFGLRYLCAPFPIQWR